MKQYDSATTLTTPRLHLQRPKLLRLILCFCLKMWCEALGGEDQGAVLWIWRRCPRPSNLSEFPDVRVESAARLSVHCSPYSPFKAPRSLGLGMVWGCKGIELIEHHRTFVILNVLLVIHGEHGSWSNRFFSWQHQRRYVHTPRHLSGCGVGEGEMPSSVLFRLRCSAVPLTRVSNSGTLQLGAYLFLSLS